MIGHEGVVRALLRMLREQLPGILHELENDLGIPAGAIRPPKSEDMHPAWVDVVSKGRFPSIMVVQEDTETRNTARQVGVEAVFDEYEWRYPLRVVIHNVGADFGETELQRKRLMMALRIAVLRHRGLVDTGDESAAIIPESVRELFSGGALNEANKLLLESSVKLEVQSFERITASQGDAGRASPVVHPAILGE